MHPTPKVNVRHTAGAFPYSIDFIVGISRLSMLYPALPWLFLTLLIQMASLFRVTFRIPAYSDSVCRRICRKNPRVFTLPGNEAHWTLSGSATYFDNVYFGIVLIFPNICLGQRTHPGSEGIAIAFRTVCDNDGLAYALFGLRSTRDLEY